MPGIARVQQQLVVACLFGNRVAVYMVVLVVAAARLGVRDCGASSPWLQSLPRARLQQRGQRDSLGGTQAV